MKSALLLVILGLAVTSQARSLNFIRATAPEPDLSDPETLLKAHEYIRLTQASQVNLPYRVQVPLVPIEPGTGLNLGSRIIGGQNAARDAHGYQIAMFVRVQYNETTQAAGFCGGSIVNKDYILTAAHCVDMPYPVLGITVYVNAHDLSLSAAEDGRDEIDAASWQVHPEWSSSTVKNDVAIVRLSRPISFTGNVRAVCLAYSGSYESIAATAVGWGKTSDAGTRADIKQVVQVNTITNSACRTSSFAWFLLVTSNHVCIDTAGGARGVCNGDSGGPLLRNSDGCQIGIVSFGSSDGCESGAPAVFSRVDKYQPFICSATGVC